MRININNTSSHIKLNKKKKNAIIHCVEFVLMEERSKGNRLFSRFLKKVDLHDMLVDLLFVDDKEIIKLNKKYFNSPEPTDVVAFSMIEGEVMESNRSIGEAVICIQTAKRNAGIFGQTFEEELFLLIIHAVLHLTGYEHNNEKGIMRRKEKIYLNYIKKEVIPVYLAG
ncbi:MAG: rRNA maturation RNase YbeY [Spirochaetes bacterium]|nr:rRNA maturation RNase YbeY [Spirochaetota bacterium]